VLHGGDEEELDGHEGEHEPNHIGKHEHAPDEPAAAPGYPPGRSLRPLGAQARRNEIGCRRPGVRKLRSARIDDHCSP
jgi:hypothetical protein